MVVVSHPPLEAATADLVAVVTVVKHLHVKVTVVVDMALLVVAVVVEVAQDLPGPLVHLVQVDLVSLLSAM